MTAGDSEFQALVDLAIYAWKPVLQLLAAEGDYSKVDFEKVQSQALHLPADWPEIRMLQLEPSADSLRYTSKEQIVEIHDAMIAEFGGTPGARDLGVIESALERMKRGQVFESPEFPTLYQKAAALMHSIMLYHPFVDGQKRTRISSAFVFLGLNGYTIWSRDVGDEIATAVRTARGELEVSDLSHWISRRAMAIHSTIFVVPFTMLLRRMDRNDSCPRCGHGVLWRTYLNECDSCGQQYAVEPTRVVLSRDHSGGQSPAEVLAVGRLIALEVPEDLERALALQKRIDEANEASMRRLKASGTDTERLLLDSAWRRSGSRTSTSLESE